MRVLKGMQSPTEMTGWATRPNGIQNELLNLCRVSGPSRAAPELVEFSCVFLMVDCTCVIFFAMKTLQVD